MRGGPPLRARLAAWWRAWVWLDLMIVGGYAALVFAFTPQWLKLLADHGAAAGLSPVMLGMTTAGMIALQVAMRKKRMGGAFRLGNALSLANVVITDLVWFWAIWG